MRILVLLGVMFLVLELSAQDTISVYFEYGSSKVTEKEARKLRVLHTDYDLRDVEYAEFIGYADSTGNAGANVKLSEKRARNALKYCENSFASNVDIRILAKGEGVQENQTLNRRVEIILHYPAVIVPLPKKEEVHNVDPRCFLVDFDALKYCNIREIKKRVRRFIYIEALPIDLFKEREHYYAIRTKLSGNVSIQRVRWKKKTTGKLWWRKTRWVATIPRASFIQYNFFLLEDAPCAGCTEEVFTADTIIMTVPKVYPDLFLMNNMQMKTRLFNRDQATIRIPKEYIDLDRPYYIRGAILQKPMFYQSQSQIEWTTKKRGRKKQDYYYTKLFLNENVMPSILQIRLTTTCLNAPVWDPSGWGWGNNMNCGTGNLRGYPLGFKGLLEPGVFYHNDTLVGYLAAGFAYSNNIYVQAQAGVNSHLGFYGAANFRYPFVGFNLQALSPSKKWVNPGGGGSSSGYGRFYAGLDTKTSFNQKYQSFFEGNLHLGIAIEPSIFGVYPEFYLQGGVSYDFMQRINTKAYGYGQFGIRFYTKSFI
jgi:hypothetical protein